ncbi:hypothetical protein M011DRAFT_62036 [Sporormia fimetaria CBS 119925]|uniref:Uncharacterized protein n=1 Tax=Sporormia fimetaria CBS 119925 TaxID=1340428 RepID=A0A6A6VBH2_9PLEO|nr:hypothetical protein M011DRAFT_62036 [Sporormia fimetaria CBS 119925]
MMMEMTTIPNVAVLSLFQAAMTCTLLLSRSTIHKPDHNPLSSFSSCTRSTIVHDIFLSKIVATGSHVSKNRSAPPMCRSLFRFDQKDIKIQPLTSNVSRKSHLQSKSIIAPCRCFQKGSSCQS